MRKLAAVLLLLILLAAGCGGSSEKSSGGTNTAAASCDKGDLDLVNSDQLTVGTDNPAFPPWFGGQEKAPWKVSDPRSGEGFESAVAYAVADELGFGNDEVKWVVVPFNTAFAPGKKKFDFDINQYTITKRVNNDDREAATREFFKRSQEDPLRALLIGRDNPEPFAALHLLAAVGGF